MVCETYADASTHLFADHFEESEQKIVELHDDDPSAAEVALRWLYGFRYEQMEEPLVSSTVSLRTVTVHLNNFIAAQKYLLPSLETAILKRLNDDLYPWHDLDGPEAESTLRVIQLFRTHSDHHKWFVKEANLLLRNRMADLLDLPEFRNLLLTAEWKYAWELCKEAILQGLEAPSRSDCEDAALQECKACGRTWPRDNAEEGLCPYCFSSDWEELAA